MRLPELQRRLQALSEKGFVPSERKGPTGIGYTLEQALKIPENNLPIPDLGGRVEMKATRSTANNLITLFTFNKSVWKHPQADIIRRWGYRDAKRGRQAFYSTVSALEVNGQGLRVVLPNHSDALSIVHAATGKKLASWDLFSIVGKFMMKFERLLLVHADSRKTKAAEEFHFNAAQLLTEPSSQTFRKSFLSGKALIDIRMYLRSGGAVRNHGTGFRVREHDLPSLFGRIVDLSHKR